MRWTCAAAAICRAASSERRPGWDKRSCPSAAPAERCRACLWLARNTPARGPECPAGPARTPGSDRAYILHQDVTLSQGDFRHKCQTVWHFWLDAVIPAAARQLGASWDVSAGCRSRKSGRSWDTVAARESPPKDKTPATRVRHTCHHIVVKSETSNNWDNKGEYRWTTTT